MEVAASGDRSTNLRDALADMARRAPEDPATALQQLVDVATRAWSSEDRLFAAALAERAASLLVESALRDREQHVAEVEALARVGSWEWDTATDRITWSDEQLRIHGLDRTTHPDTFAAFIARVHPEDRARVIHECELLVRTGAPFAFAYRVVRPDGVMRWLHARGQMRPDAAGKLTRMVGTSHDITDRKQIEDALRISEESYRTIFDLSNDAIFVHDLETGDVLDANQRACESVGCTLAELKAKGLALIADETSSFTRERAAHHLQRAAAGEPQRFEWRTRDTSGNTVWSDVQLHRVTILGKDRLLATVRDISERKASEQVLRASEESYRTIFQHAADAMWLHDLDTGEFLDVNDAAVQVYGYSAEESKALGVQGLSHGQPPYDIEHARAYMARAAAGEPQRFEWLGRHKDGSEVWGEVQLRRVNILGVDRMLATARDINDRKRAEQALRRANEELERRVDERTAQLERARADAERTREEAERANRAKSEFLSRMSHELRTPMNSILGFAQVLARGELRAEQERSVQHITRAGRHLLRLINEVLEIARIEAGRQSMSIEPVALAPALREALGLLRPLATQSGILLEGEPWEDGEAFVRADRQRLVQILLNLLSNGIKYNRAGGSVRLTCGRVPGEQEDARMWVRVEDTGRGVPADQVDDLFTPFARLGAEQSDVEGTGLGLALSLRMAEAMGGTLSLERTSPLGSVFLLELAAASSPAGARTEAAAENRGQTSLAYPPATLLYIEDNLANFTLVETFLEFRPGWRIIPALQGGIGLELARENRPDLILLDLHLPDMHGDDVLRGLRADPRTRTIPVVIVSADATRTTLDRLRRAGADAYLTKPLDMDEFLITLEQQLARTA